MMRYLIIVVCFAGLLAGCQYADSDHSTGAIQTAYQSNEWADYWYAGEAEISVYEGKQARYSDQHPARAVLIFVTEDFLTDKQVKNESSQKRGSASVLKTNLIRRFTTGMYDYSMMTSVFTPINADQYPHTLKITSSSQDWCGQSFVQLNHRNNQYQVQLFSYFEKEGDQDFRIGNHLTEDELFNRIRLGPQTLPTGDIKLIPSTVYSRLKHLPVEPVDAVVQSSPYSGSEFSGQKLDVYEISYPDLDRVVKIFYESAFPHAIAGWSDTYPVMGGEQLSTLYQRVSTIKSPYWSLHDLEDLPLRKDMGISSLP